MINDYIKTNWQNDPSTNTPLSAANLNHMEEGIAQNNADIKTLDGKITTITTDYEALDNKPQINNVVLVGNKTSNDLNIQGKLTAGANITIENDVISSSDSYDDSELRAEISAQERKIRLLEEAAMGKLYTQETNISYSNDVNVPSGALSLATLDMLGGMSRKGKNLIDISRTITMYHLPSPLPSGTYTLSMDNDKEALGFRMSKTTDTSHDSVSNGVPSVLNGRKYITLTTTFETNYVNISSGSVIGTELTRLMLENGSTPTTYEPYTDQLIDGKVDDVVSYGKNLVSDLIKGYYLTSSGAFTVGTDYSMQIAKVENGKTYTITTDDSSGFVGGFFNEYPTITSTTYNQSRVVQTNKTFVAPINGYVVFRTSSNYGKAQLELGSTSTSYEPYREPKHHPINESILSLPNYGIGINNNVYNYLEFKDGKVLHHENCGVADGGLLGWNYSGLGHFFAPLSTLRDDNDLPLLCSKLTTSTWANVQAKSEDKIIATSSGKYLRAYDSGFGGDATSFKTSMNGVPIYYPLETEIITDVTDLFPLGFNELEVEPNGHISFHYPNDYKVDVPSTISYLINIQGVLNNG